ncbi:MAG: hypothetical protein E6767_10120 [Dysgonomonas sp.]|nr:hypothetical protein [Dysgonomonas sp.]
MVKDINFKVLAESSELQIGHLFEDTYLLRKRTKEYYYLCSFYGDPTCALIDYNNSFCLVGGVDNIILWKENKIINIGKDMLYPTFDIRQKGYSTVEILTDPWSGNPAIWVVDIKTLAIQKRRDFFEYKNKEYTENIEW